MNNKNLFLLAAISLGLGALSGCGKKQKTYTIYWKNYDGTLLETDKDVLEGATPTYDGEEPKKEWEENFKYLFTGWSPKVSPVSEETTYTAVFETKPRLYYTVYWKNYDGSILEIDQHVEEGTTPTFDGSDPVKQKDDTSTYKFNGWDKEVGPITGETSYTAVFAPSPREYKVQWLNYNNVLLYEEMVGYGSVPEYKGETPTRESTLTTDYAWDPDNGWDRTVGPVEGNMVYKAIFQETVFDTVKIAYQLPVLKHTITNNNVTKVREGTNVTLEGPSADGYDFLGWFLDEDYKKPVTSLPNLSFDVRLYAKFAPHTYTITYVDSGEALAPNPTSITCLEKVTLNGCSKTGYKFIAWKDKTGKTYTELDDVCQDIELTAVYEANSYVITLKYSEQNDKYINIKFDQKVNLDQPHKDGYTFLGWYFQDQPEVKFELETYNLLHDVTLIQKWSEAIQYDITFVLDGGDELVDPPTQYSIESYPELPVPTKTGYDFAGWYDGSKEFTSFTGLFKPITLEAHWVPHNVVINFDYDGGSLQRKVIYKDGSEKVLEKAVSPFETTEFLKLEDKAGYQFNGWLDNNGKRVTFLSDSTISSDMTLNATWAELTENAVNAHINEDQEFTIDGFNYQYYQFTPLVDQSVKFESLGDFDLKASLFKKGDKESLIEHDDKSDLDRNFEFSYNLKANTTYLLKVESNGGASGSATIKATSEVASQVPTGKINAAVYRINSTYQKFDEAFKDVGVPVKEGKTFVKWQDENGNEVKDGDILTSELINLIAIWED